MTKPKKKFGAGKYPKKFSYTYGDLSQILGCSIEATKKHAQRGHFDPKDLISVLEFIHERLSSKENKAKLEEGAEKLDGIGYSRGDVGF